MIKVCKTCKEEKPLSAYYADKTGRQGVRARCKSCERPAHIARNRTAPKQDRSEYFREHKRKWREANRGKARAHVAAYRARKLQATPPWADMEAIKDVYLEAAYHGMQVDHIIPLKGEKVSGLHVWENLQLLSARENQRKNNRYNLG